MYCCGPTVYDFAHIGNWRTFVFADLVRRYLEFKGHAVTHVMNNLNSSSGTYRPVFKYRYVVNSVSTPVAAGGVASVFDGACTAASCAAAAIQSVGIDLQVQLTGGAQIEDSTVVYTLSPISSQYDSSVG